MHRRKDVEQTAHYRQQASACARAAALTAIAEVRQAYLDLEQGWLCLALKPKESGGGVADPQVAPDADTKFAAGAGAVTEAA